MWNTWRVLGIFLMFTCGILGMASAQVFTKIIDFNGDNGQTPVIYSLAQDFDGSLNGTTEFGGPGNFGVTFRLTKRDRVHPVNSCQGVASNPWGGVILGSDGDFYGMSFAGNIFRVTRDRKLSYVAAVGGGPITLMQAIGGRFYGTTDLGGTDNAGSVFEMSREGEVRTLHSFDTTDGCHAGNILIQGADGNLYGTTKECGGPENTGFGTLYKMTLDGTLTVLHVFNADDGALPDTPLIQGSDGSFYGATAGGGAYANGTVFKMTPDGSVKTLYSFCGMSCGDGDLPTSLIQASDGNFYGTTGLFDSTIFELSLNGNLRTLHTFSYFTDGDEPVGLTQSTNGILYGATEEGGVNQAGTLFQLDMGIPPFVTFVKKGGKVGEVGAILGQGFTGTTDVMVNGTPASFTIVSDTYIKATIPQGATSGYVTVTTPTGVLTSNVPFTVLP